MASETLAIGRRGVRPSALGLLLGAAALGAMLLPQLPAHAQNEAPQSAAQGQAAASQAPLGADEIEKLVGPIALYPDDLIGVVLPASTYPLQVVEAARFLEARKKDSTLKPDPSWDDSVVALLNYPDVVQLLNDNLDWTWRLGQAVLNQRGEVLNAIQQFRDRAYAAGNLRSDDRQVVNKDDQGDIAITPANPEVVYVPYYDPSDVVVYQPDPVFYYYPTGYPLYYYPYPVNYVFDTGFFWGVTTAFIVGWHTDRLVIEHCGYAGHPYFGRHYYEPFYVRNDIHLNVALHRGGEVWQPRHYDLGRPFAANDARRIGNPYAGGHHASFADGHRDSFSGARRDSFAGGGAQRGSFAGGGQRRNYFTDGTARRDSYSNGYPQRNAAIGARPSAPRTDTRTTQPSGAQGRPTFRASPRTEVAPTAPRYAQRNPIGAGWRQAPRAGAPQTRTPEVRTPHIELRNSGGSRTFGTIAGGVRAPQAPRPAFRAPERRESLSFRSSRGEGWNRGNAAAAQRSAPPAGGSHFGGISHSGGARFGGNGRSGGGGRSGGEHRR